MFNNEYIGRAPTEDVPVLASKYIQYWLTDCQTTRRLDRWRRNHSAFYLFDDRAGSWNYCQNEGVRKDYFKLVVNNFKNIGKNAMQLVIGDMPLVKASSEVSDASVSDQIEVYNAILENDANSGWLYDITMGGVLQSWLYGTCFAIVEYDPLSGDSTPLSEDRFLSHGDISAENLSVLDFYFDTTKKKFSDLDWCITRQRINKYKLASIYQEKENDIISAKLQDINNVPAFFDYNTDYSDDVFVYKLFCKDDPYLVPGGRIVTYLNNSVVLSDTENRYKDIPVKSLPWCRTPYGIYGDTDANDMYQVQKLQDAVTSCLMTKISAFGIDKIVTETNSLIDEESLTGGLKLFKMAPNTQKPFNLNLMGDISGLVNFFPYVKRMQEDISNINQAVRGTPDPSIKAAITLTTLESMAKRYVNESQKNVHSFIVDCSMFALELRKKYSDYPQMIRIVGKDKKYKVKRWIKSDISLVDSVRLDAVDPVTSSINGKIMIAEKVSQMGGDISQYIRSLKTGSYDDIIDPIESQLNLAEMENQVLDDFSQEIPLVMMDDDHARHKIIHNKRLSDIDARKNRQLVSRYQDHLQWHDEQEIAQAQQQSALNAAKQSVPFPVNQQTVSNTGIDDEGTIGEDVTMNINDQFQNSVPLTNSKQRGI